MYRYKSLIFYAAAVLVLSLAYMASPVSRAAVWQLFPHFEALAQANPLATALIFLVTSTVFAFLAFPSMPMIYMAAGFYMDEFRGGATVMIGSAFGCLGAFLFYRNHMRQWPNAPLNRRSPMKFWLTLLGLRLSPLVPAPLVNLFAAAFHVSPLQYLTTSLLGSAPLILFFTQVGEHGRQFLTGETMHWRQFSGYLVILILSTLLTAMGPWRSVLNELKKLKRSSGSKQGPLEPVPNP